MHRTAPLPAATSTGLAGGATERPGRLRRTGLVVTGVLACVLPAGFTVNLARMLLVGELPEHRFHQLTGQGLALCALWLAGLVPLLRAGWAGRRPTPVAAALHLTLAACGTVCAVAAPGGGAPFLLGVLVVTGALVWAVLPLRPRLRSTLQVDPVLAPLWLLVAAATMPYVLDQISLQNAATGHHAANPHLFDMAWFATTLVLLGVLGAVVPALRRLGPVAGAGLAWTGAVGTALGADRPWTPLALLLGTLAVALPTLLARRSDRARAARPVI